MELKPKAILIHVGLFVVTFVTTTFAGVEWVYGPIGQGPIKEYSLDSFMLGLPYSVPFLLILSAHEFGHYFVALYNKVKATLPYYIPLPPNFPLFGTLGAIIRLKSRVESTQQNFDIGIAGPLAGFVVTLGVLWYGFATLPPPEYVFQFHPEYQEFGLNYAATVYSPEYLANRFDVIIGKNFIYYFFEILVGDPARVPNVHEIMHYPCLLAGFLSLIFTSINLLPVGQLDGGHILYGLVGFRGHRIVATTVFIMFVLYSGFGLVNPGSTMKIGAYETPHIVSIIVFVGFLYMCFTGLKVGWKNQLMIALAVFSIQYLGSIIFPSVQGYPGWLLFAFLIGRFVGVMHPPSETEAPLTMGRKVLGWIALLIFVISFAPAPIRMIIDENPQATETSPNAVSTLFSPNRPCP